MPLFQYSVSLIPHYGFIEAEMWELGKYLTLGDSV